MRRNLSCHPARSRIVADMQSPSEPRWLTPCERDAWIAIGSVVMRLVPALDAQLQRDAGINFFEYTILSVLSEAPDRTLRMGQLAILAEGSPSRLSQAVSRLERRGWISRAPDPADGRFTLATLTEAGWDTVVATAPGHLAEVRRLVIDPLTDEQLRALQEIGSTVMRAIDPNDRCLTRAFESPSDSSDSENGGQSGDSTRRSTASMTAGQGSIP